MRAFIFSIVLLITLSIFYFSLRKLYKAILIGKPENRFDRIYERIKNVFIVAFAQSKLFREPVAGLMHALIFWGFCVLLIVVIESLIQGFFPAFSFNFLGYFYSIITFTQDLFGVLVLIGILIAVVRRFILRVPRLHSEKDGNMDAVFILTLITIIILSMFGLNIHNYHIDVFAFRFVSDFLRETLEVKKSHITFELFLVDTHYYDFNFF